jgi:hypothetical protein
MQRAVYDASTARHTHTQASVGDGVSEHSQSREKRRRAGSKKNFVMSCYVMICRNMSYYVAYFPR